MKFVYPWVIVLAFAVPLIGLVWAALRLRAEKRMSKIVAPALASRLLPPRPRLTSLQSLLLLAGLFLCVFSCSRPQWGHSAQVVQTRCRNVVVALDVSRSMLAADVRPNRLERAKADIADLIDSLEGDRCALVAFRRTGVLVCPLTTDHGFLRSTLEKLTVDSAPVGETDLGAAIRTSLDALDPAADDHNAIILISDGGDLRGGALAAATTAKQRNVPVFTVGLGNPKAESTIPAADGPGVQQYKNAAVKTRLDEKPLAEIARASGGRYVPLATAGTAETTLGAIYRRFLRAVAAKEQAEEEELRATERFGLFLVPGIVLMMLAAAFSRGRFAGRVMRMAVVALVLPTVAAEDVETDSEVWNRGVDYYRAGDVTNALATLKPLMLSRTHGARAAEVVGALAYDKKDLEEATAAMQIALRANPDDARAQRNFTRASDKLPELREQKHIESVLKTAQGKQPDQLLGNAVTTARKLMEDAKGVLTNAPTVAIAKSERLAKEAEQLADTWIPVKAAIAQSVTNEQQAAHIIGDIESARDATAAAAEALADMTPTAGTELAKSESALTRFWKLTVMPPDAVAADIVAQTNAYQGVDAFNGRGWQEEALEFTRAFRARFPEWAAAYEQQAQSDTNKPPFTKEQQAEIAALATEVEKEQIAMVKAELPPKQLEILTKLERIKELLPKDKNGGGGDNNQQQNQNQNKDNKDDKQKQQDDKQNQQDQQQNQNDQQQQQEQQQQEQQQQAEQKEDPKTDEQVEALLRKAQERSDEHENEKKARMNKVPPSPNERDW